MKASILSIGTELVDGQIINRNSPWISKKLKDHGLQTILHLVVPDERRLMRDGLELCARESDLIFVTGGLGPTSDDFTRDIVAAWAGQPLQFHDPSWLHLSERLTSRGYAVKEIQRQQCFFPQGSEVLVNSQGTANAFYLESQGKKVFVLPGPPREIEAVWESAIGPWLEKNTTHLDPHITRIWDTMGRGESDIAVLVEDAVQGSGLEIGYRVHLPYVEVKLSHKKSQDQTVKPWVDKVTDVLAPYTLLRDGADATTAFITQLQATPSFEVQDAVTGSFLLNRLSPFLHGPLKSQKWGFSNSSSANTSTLLLKLTPLSPFSCEARLKYQQYEFVESLQSPYTTVNMIERSQQYLAELALVFWSKKLAELEEKKLYPTR